ncbi:piwi-like protein 1 [Brevipalpus obovatus]|uniref:piwi-like protein 1 n=1 Tax=Brevipalpus obovatus TaxID=246614 RepID=UPI003D9DEBED
MAGRATRGRGAGSAGAIEGDRPTRGRGRGSSEPVNTIPDGVKKVHGEGGAPVTLLSNYYRLITPKDAIIHAYRVDFEPPVESVRMRRALIYDNREKFGTAYVFDGGNEIKSLKKLKSEETTVSGIRKSDDAQISITIRHTSIVTWGHPEMMRLYNTQMKRNLQSIGMMQIGRNYHDKNQRKSLPKWKIEIWPGIVTAINEHDGGILMVNNIVHKIVRLGTAYDLLQELLKSDRDKFKSNARQELSGKIVMVKYNNKTYRIDDIIFDKNPITYTFERRGQSISLKDYYKEQHNVTLKDENQPLLLVKPTERDKRSGQDQPIMLIPELCLLTGLTDQMRSNFELKKEMEGMTSTTPMGRVGALNAFIRKLAEDKNVREEMAAWKLRFEPSIITVPGRTLPVEKILMRGDPEKGGTQYYQKTGSFENEIRSKNLRKAVGMDSWAIICLSRDRQLITEYCTTLSQVARPLGIDLAAPKIFPLDNDRTSTYVECCKRVPNSYKLVNIIVPNGNKDRYDAIKKIFCCENPRASQVVTTRVLQKKNALQTICTKICIQMSVKLGAEAWALHIPPKNMMIAGYDCYHDSAKKGSSVGAFVCSLNQSATRWYSRVTYHQSREEMSGNFSMHLTNGLKEYASLNGQLPDRLIVYRDGVGEGQINYVYDFEMAQIKSALDKLIGPGKIKWSFIIVTKRINARFFLKVDAKSIENPPPGTVVDTVVTRKERYDFYLISQSVRKGTVNPTMYNIIGDSTDWQPHHHQQLAYKLCHLYFNWAGTITVPAPCQYAHKLAFLTGTSLHREPHAKLSNFLFYL